MKDYDLIALNERNIRTALEDYMAHTQIYTDLDKVSDTFIHRIAVDNAESKAELRELLRKSPVWDEELQAVVINGKRTHEPNGLRIHKWLCELLKTCPDYEFMAICGIILSMLDHAEADDTQMYIDAVNTFAPHAYKPGKKTSRVLLDLAKAVGVADETKGSEFQRLYAQIADELSAKKIDYKLFVSINPAHFLTMSNPKGDNRGPMLTTCHSLNSEYEYRNGCFGYARDKYSMIAFTAADPNVPETLNNRKTTRQIFVYKPYSGVLLQSRLYDSHGGAEHQKEMRNEYRALVEGELSQLEDVPNLWGKPRHAENESIFVPHPRFAGYADWQQSRFKCLVVARKDAEDVETMPPVKIGESPVCIHCGGIWDGGVNRLLCRDCRQKLCSRCGKFLSNGERMLDVFGSVICDDCYRSGGLDGVRYVGWLAPLII